MSTLGTDRRSKARRNGDRDRREQRRAGGVEDLKFSVQRVKKALRNSPTRILRAEDTQFLAKSNAAKPWDQTQPPPGRFLVVPIERARAFLHDLWGGSGLD